MDNMFKYRTFTVSHGKDGFSLQLEEHSRVRDAIANGYESLATHTGHWLCCRTYFGNIWLNKLMNWAWRKEVTLAEIEIDRAMADKLAYGTDSWSYLDNDDEDEVE